MGGAGRRAGFTLIELLIALSILAVGILATAALFPTGYTTVASSGNATMANAAAQQILEDLRSVDFVNLPVLNGFDTGGPAGSVAGLPSAATNPVENAIARKWGFALDGGVVKWGLNATEQSIWVPLTAGSGGAVPLGARGRIAVVDVNTSLRRVNVTLTLPGGGTITGSSLYANMML